MTSIFLKIIYLLIGSGLTILGIKYYKIDKKDKKIRAILFLVAYCFAFWGISSLFHTSEGYPRTWFFYITTVPVLAIVFYSVLKIKK